MKLLIAVCTRQRPKMLRDCLKSILTEINRLTARVSGGELAVELLLVENDTQEMSKSIVAEQSQSFAVPISYHLEQKIGIVAARNRALAIIAEKNVDWVCFIDDDATVEQNWLISWMDQLDSHKAGVFQGPVQFHYQSRNSNSSKNEFSVPKARIEYLKTAATCNTMFAARLITNSKVRFSEDFNLTGGEDNEFFYRLADAGAKILSVNHPLVTEHVPASRQELGYVFKRHFAVGTNQVRINWVRNGWFASLARYAPKAMGRLILSLFLCAPIVARVVMFREDRTFQLENLVKKLGSAFGLIWGLLGFQIEIYRTVDGY